LGSFKEPGPLRFAPYHFGPPIAKEKTQNLCLQYICSVNYCKECFGALGSDLEFDHLYTLVLWGQTLNLIICIRKGQRREGP